MEKQIKHRKIVIPTKMQKQFYFLLQINTLVYFKTFKTTPGTCILKNKISVIWQN